MVTLKSAYLFNPDLSYYWPQLASFTPNKRASELNRSNAMKALQLLDQKLGENKHKVTVILIGGGAMLLVYGGREYTQDLDIIPTGNDIELIEECRDEVTKEMKAQGVSLPSDWINSQCAPIFKQQMRYLQPGDIRPIAKLDFPNLKVFVATPEALLTLKVQALRDDNDAKDYKDVYTLCKLLKIKSWEQFVAVVEPRMEDLGFIGNEDILTLKRIIAKV